MGLFKSMFGLGERNAPQSTLLENSKFPELVGTVSQQLPITVNK